MSLTVDDATSVETPAIVTAAPVVGKSENELPEPVVVEATAPGEAILDLDRELTWRLDVEAAGFWVEGTQIAGRSDLDDLSVRLIPTATLTAQIETAQGSEGPAELGVRFRPPGKLPADPGSADETVHCPVAEDRWRCQVPSGIYDLRLRAQGFVSHYLWQRELPPRGNVDLGRLELVPGSSVSGWLVTDDDSTIRPGTRVVARPRSMEPAPADTEARHRSLANEAAVTERGFFHLQGLLPGAYVLDAEHEGYVLSRDPTVVVTEDSASELPEPLVLTRPTDVRVTIEPPVDAMAEPWSLTLGRQPLGSEPAHAGHSGPTGSWTKRALRPGTYSLMIQSSQGSRLAVEDVQVAGPETEHLVVLDFVEVEGIVTLGGEPLEADLAFGGANGPVSIKLDADEEGRFSGSLPRPGAWDVDVRSTSPGVFRRLRAVEVEPVAGSDHAWVEIELPATRLEGEVVDTEGDGVARATVLVVPVPIKPGDPAEMPSHVRSDEDGLFVLEGFEPATYRLQAIRPVEGRRELSEPVEVILDDGHPPPTVRLVLGSPPSLRGRVLSAGGGVPGATVMARHLGETAGISVPTVLTEADGRFELSLPNGATRAELTVLAPGFLFYRQAVEIPDDQELPVLLEQQGGGVLVIQPNEPIVLNGGKGRPWVVQEDGTQIDFGTLSFWSALNHAAPAGATLEVPMMPSGGYEVCWPRTPEQKRAGRDRQCDGGYLPDYGRLEIAQHEEDPERPGQQQQPVD